MKYFIFLGAFLCLQVFVFALSKDEVRLEFDRLIENVIQTIQDVLSDLQNVSYQIQLTGSHVLSQGKASIQSEVHKLTEQFNKLESSAVSEHVNASACTKTTRIILAEISDLAMLNLESCVIRFSSRGTDEIYKASGRLNRFVDEVYALDNSLETCSNATCLDSVLATIKSQENDIPRKIHEEERFAMNKAEANRILLKSCDVDAAQEVVKYGSRVIEDVTQCLDRLIHPLTPKPLF